MPTRSTEQDFKARLSDYLRLALMTVCFDLKVQNGNWSKIDGPGGISGNKSEKSKIGKKSM